MSRYESLVALRENRRCALVLRAVSFRLAKPTVVLHFSHFVVFDPAFNFLVSFQIPFSACCFGAVGPTMLNSSRFYLLGLVQYLLIQTVLSNPNEAPRNLTGSHLDIVPRVSSSVTHHLLNITSLVEGAGIWYQVPNTMTILCFHLGFRCKEAGIISTINSARDYCEQQLVQKGDGPLPRNEDPFHEDLAYGAAIDVLSSQPNHRLTWGILKDSMEGLWEFLVVDGRFVESEFDIYHGTLDLVARGTIREAPEK